VADAGLAFSKNPSEIFLWSPDDHGRVAYDSAAHVLRQTMDRCAEVQRSFVGRAASAKHVDRYSVSGSRGPGRLISEHFEVNVQRLRGAPRCAQHSYPYCGVGTVTADMV
jgi:hypothetical protein